MKRKPIAILAAGLLATVGAAQAADDNVETTGSVTVGLRGIKATANDASKLNEYRDLDSGVAAGFELRKRSDTDYLNGYGENLGREDQYINLNGGSYGSYKYGVSADYLRHNFGSGPGALTPYSGIGTTTLNATLPNPNVATWHQFDHAYKRRELNAMFELQKTSPWYTRAEYNEVTRNGINVFSGANGTSPGNGFTDLPAPIDYTTRNYFLEAGYSGGRSHFAANALYSTFDNANDVLRWSNAVYSPTNTNLDSTVLPPDNQMLRYALNGNVRRLTLDSTLAGRLTYTKLTNNVSVLQNMLTTGNVVGATNPNEPNFRGDLRKTDFQLSLASHPVRALDTKIYWNYANESNHSTQMTFSPTAAGLPCSPAPCRNELFHLKKNNVGAEAGYRLSRANKLLGGIDFARMERERVDFPESKERKWFAEWKNSSLDWLTGRVKYQRLSRESKFDDTAFAAFAANPMDFYVRRFDLANVEQNAYKLVLDLTPMPLLDVGFEAIVKRNDYKDTTLGRRDDSRQEYYVSVGYGRMDSLRVLAFGDIEYVKFDSSHRVGPGSANPETAPTATNYNWNATNKDRAWQVGLGADWLPLSHFTVKTSVIYAETRGTTDFMVQPGGAVGPFPAITNFDNTRRTSFNLKGIWDYSKEWQFTAGYSFERYRYSDIGYDGTRYVTSATATAGSTTGQYAFQPYTANIVYGLAKYRF